MNAEQLTEPAIAPSSEQVELFIGRDNFELWESLIHWIAQTYPDVFVPEWLRTGKKSGWYLRYKKNKSFCQFIPYRNHFKVLVTFGAEEREKVKEILDQLSSKTRKAYNDAKTFHDGKWLYLIVDSEYVVDDLQILLGVKRRIKKVS